MDYSIKIENRCSSILFLIIERGSTIEWECHNQSLENAAKSNISSLHIQNSFHNCPDTRLVKLFPECRVSIRGPQEWTLTIRQFAQFRTLDCIIHVYRSLLLHVSSQEPFSWTINEIKEDLHFPSTLLPQHKERQYKKKQRYQGKVRTNLKSETAESSNGIDNKGHINDDYIDSSFFRKNPFDWKIDDDFVNKAHLNLSKVDIRDLFNKAIDKLMNLKQDKNMEFEFFLEHPQILQLTRTPSEVIAGDVNVFKLLSESLDKLARGNIVELKFNYYTKDENSKENSPILFTDPLSHLTFPTRTPGIGPTFCIDIFHIQVGQMSDWETTLLYELIFNQKMTTIGLTHGCIVPLFDLCSLTNADSASFMRMRIAQLFICVSKEKVQIGSFVWKLVQTLAKARLQLINKFASYFTNEIENATNIKLQLVKNFYIFET